MTLTKRPERERAMLELVETVENRATDVARSSPDHGPRHWRDVARVAQALWAEGMEADLTALFVFALMHDSQRLNEFDDPEHGMRAAKLLRDPTLMPLLADLLEAEIVPSLEVAMQIHPSGATSDNPFMGTCLDADRLTLYRVGKVPDKRFLSTDFAREDHFRKIIGLAIVEDDDVTWEAIVDAYVKECPIDTRASVVLDQGRGGNGAYAHTRRYLRGGTLCDELQQARVDLGEGGPMGSVWIMHPMIHEPFIPGSEAHLNERLKLKEVLVQEKLDEGNWFGALLHIERPYRVVWLHEIVLPRIDDPKVWWEVVSHIWTDSENIWQEVERWDELFEEAPEGDPMNDEEREVWDALPEEITIYRGTCAPDGIGSGMSWTIDKEKAIWFADRLHIPGQSGDPKVVTAVVRKEAAIGYQSARGEKEIIARWEDVHVISTDSVEKARKGVSKKSEEVVDAS